MNYVLIFTNLQFLNFEKSRLKILKNLQSSLRIPKNLKSVNLQEPGVSKFLKI